MKKFLFGSVAVLMIFSGCQIGSFFGAKTTDRVQTPESKVLTLTGTIAENSKNSVLQKSFILKNENGRTVYLLESDQEDLSAYVGQGEVEVTGEKKESSAAEELPILNVYSVQFLAPPVVTPTLYTAAELGLSIALPPNWKFTGDAALVEFLKDDDRIATLEKIASETPAGAKITAEFKIATEITVGGKQAYRIIRAEDATDIVLPLEKIILVFHFSGNAAAKADFYDLLQGVKFAAADTTPTAPAHICGGIAGFGCPAGYRCELQGDYPDASGTCVLVPAKNTIVSPSGPIIAPESLPKPLTPQTPEAEPIAPASEVDGMQMKVMEYLRRNLNALAPEKLLSGSWEIENFTFSEPSLVSVAYLSNKDATTRRKLLFSYSFIDANLALKQKAYFVPGETTDWKLESGENLQRSGTQEIFSSDGVNKSTVAEGYRYYENANYHFSIAYPQSYYYANFGKKIVFSDVPATAENAVVTLEILDGQKSERVQSGLEILLPRDANSHFRLSITDSEKSAILSDMAKSLVSTL